MNPFPSKKAPVPTKTQDASTTTIQADYLPTLPCSKALLKAHFAEAGFVVHDAADGYIVVRADWGLSRHCKSLAELQTFARKVGVTQ